MRIRLDLSRNCIETEIRKRHERCMSRYFKKSAERPAIEGELVLLEEALASLDFGALRARYAALSGHSDAAVVLARDDGGRLAILVDGAAVDLPAVPAKDPP